MPGRRLLESPPSPVPPSPHRTRHRQALATPPGPENPGGTMGRDRAHGGQIPAERPSRAGVPGMGASPAPVHGAVLALRGVGTSNLDRICASRERGHRDRADVDATSGSSRTGFLDAIAESKYLRPAVLGGATSARAASGAQASIDGAGFIGDYGPALWSQNVGTQFANNTDGTEDLANGSEIDSLFGSLSGGNLLLGVGGNIETNFNRVLLFVDFQDGGQNTISNTNPDINFDNFNANVAGLTFDPGFGADLVIDYTNGDSGGQSHFMSAAQLNTDGTGVGGFVAGGLKADGSIAGEIPGISGAMITADGDNSNVLGVNDLGLPFDSDPATVETGAEFMIALAALGWDGVSAVRVTGFITSGNFDFTSNQVIGGLPDGTGNLATTSGVNFGDIEGDQFVLVPTPASAALLGLGGLCSLRRRR